MLDWKDIPEREGWRIVLIHLNCPGCEEISCRYIKKQPEGYLWDSECVECGDKVEIWKKGDDDEVRELLEKDMKKDFPNWCKGRQSDDGT